MVDKPNQYEKIVAATDDYSNRSKKFGAALVALLAGLSIFARLGLRVQQSDGIWDALTFLSQFFTILTNTLVFATMLAIALGRRVSPAVLRAIVISIACVGLVYHALLSHLVSFSGLELLADHGTHTIVPLLTVIWWLLWANNPRLTWRDPLLWVAWPALYTSYILVRASFSGYYPYPFFDLPKLGAPALALNTIGLGIGFILIGIALFGLARLLPVRR